MNLRITSVIVILLLLSIAVSSPAVEKTPIVPEGTTFTPAAPPNPEVVRLAAALTETKKPADKSSATDSPAATDVPDLDVKKPAEDTSSNLTLFPAAGWAKEAPLPMHTIEGTGGILITPTAYLVNPGPKDSLFGLPAASVTYVGAGEKNIQTVALSETVYRRVEFSYGMSRFGLGTLPDHVKDATGIDIGRSDVYLHNFNARVALLDENSFNLPLPAITGGVSFKVNEGIGAINSRLGGALTNAGLGDTSGVDYTLTASKTFGNVFGRPLITSAGLRLSEAAQIGYLGFGNSYHPSFEGNAAYLLTDWLAIATEFRQKINTFDPIGDLVQKEDNWLTVGLGFIITKHLTATVGWGYFGKVLDTTEDGGYAVQIKYDF